MIEYIMIFILLALVVFGFYRSYQMENTVKKLSNSFNKIVSPDLSTLYVNTISGVSDVQFTNGWGITSNQGDELQFYGVEPSSGNSSVAGFFKSVPAPNWGVFYSGPQVGGKGLTSIYNAKCTPGAFC